MMPVKRGGPKPAVQEEPNIIDVYDQNMKVPTETNPNTLVVNGPGNIVPEDMINRVSSRERFRPPNQQEDHDSKL